MKYSLNGLGSHGLYRFYKYQHNIQDQRIQNAMPIGFILYILTNILVNYDPGVFTFRTPGTTSF